MQSLGCTRKGYTSLLSATLIRGYVSCCTVPGGRHRDTVAHRYVCLGSVLKDLELPAYVQPIVLSDEERIEKPSQEIFLRAIQRVSSLINSSIQPQECLHVGDELPRCVSTALALPSFLNVALLVIITEP